MSIHAALGFDTTAAVLWHVCVEMINDFAFCGAGIARVLVGRQRPTLRPTSLSLHRS